VLAHGWQTIPKGPWSDHVNYLNFFVGTNHICETAEARVVKFHVQVNVSSVSPGITKYPLMGLVRVTGSFLFFNFGPNRVFGSGEAMHFRCRVLIDTEEYYSTYMIDCVQGHVTSLYLGK